MKIAHLHLLDYMDNKKTLVCRLTDEGSLKYIHYGGWGSSGMGYSLSNLQCDLPLEKLFDEQTKGEFVEWLIDIINNQSVYRVDKEVQKVTF